MATFFDRIDDSIREFISRQRMFVTGTAASTGRINVSPKGMDTFRILDEKTVAYLDVTGSGNETSAHIKHDGRLTIMMCSFEQKPLILRIYGRGEVVLPGDARWPEVSAHFEVLPGTRQIVVLHIESMQTSCGYGVPRMQYQGDRNTLVEYAESKGEAGIATYQQKNNLQSIDGFSTHLAVESTKD